MEQHQMTEYLAVFLADMEEHLQILEDSLLQVERHGSSQELVGNIFRAAHSLKGSSAAMGFTPMAQLTHRMEDVLDKIRSEALLIDRDVMDLLFQCLDSLGYFKQLIEKGEAPEEVDSLALIDRMDTILACSYQGNSSPVEGSLTIPEMLLSSCALNEEALAGSEQEGIQPFIVHVKLGEQTELKTARFHIIVRELGEVGLVAATYPDLNAVQEDLDERYFLLLTEYQEEEIRQRVLQDSDIEKVHFEKWSKAADMQEQPDKACKRKEQTLSFLPEKKNKTVRIDVERLDLLMNTLSELVIYQTRSVQVSSELAGQYRGEKLVSDLLENTATMSKVISELQEHVIKTRMQPVEQLFNRLPRMIRDLSNSLGKEVELVLEGGETELDRTILEEISDPLMHILRNSIDHGIEDYEKRVERNKPARGNIKVSAMQQENDVTLTVSDDGAGIDPEKIKKSAIEKKLISEQEAGQLTDEQAIQLIFAPGFSTAEKVTDISGRGVGMDIVKSRIEKLNGIIDIHSAIGKGSDFQIRLPLTMAIIRGILFKLGQRIFALPMSNTLEILNVRQQDIEYAAGQAVCRYRDSFLPLKWVHEDFDIPRKQDDKDEHKVIVVGISDKRFIMPVDELIGFQDIVVKPISDKVEKKDVVSNATILGNGHVALILDAAGIYKSLTSL